MNIKIDKKRKAGLGLCIAVALVLLGIGFVKVSNRPAYIERTVLNDEEGQNIAVMDSQTVIEQEMKMPYSLLEGIDIKIGTYGRNNNSFWKIGIREKESGKEVFQWKYNASQVSDGEKYFCRVKPLVKVDKEKTYVLSVQSMDATGNSALSFYASENDSYEDGRLFVDGKEQEGDLCVRVYGGEKDSFWGFFYLLLAGTGAGILLLSVYHRRRGNAAAADKLLGVLGIVCVYMILMYVFTRENVGTFTDECDNIRGGILIARGKVLYRDYYTQHTPLGYYLCAPFALLGAHNIQQFRLMYYLLSALLWGGLYYRHCDYFGKVKMFLLPVAQIVIFMPMFFQASKIMGDNVQGFCMAELVMEYIRYWKDGELGKSRCLIVSACIFASIASAFVSVFAIAPVVVSVLLKEVLLWKEKGSIRVKEVLRRYGFFLPVMCLPYIAAIVYFVLNHAARQMYRMAYQFNTMVYNNYQDQFGRVKWKPFVLGIKNFFGAISDNFNAVITAAGSDTAVIQLFLAVGAVASLLLWWRRSGKKDGIAAVLAIFLCMSGNGTRSSVDFHAVALWNVALTLIILLGIEKADVQKWREKKTAAILLACIGCYLIKPYAAMTADHAVYSQGAVGDVDEQIVAMTEPGEEIFMDAYVHDSIYLLYKERYPANRNCYILPWYMDWFEYDTLEDLEEKKPRIAVYQPEVEVYGQTGFCPVLDMAIQGRYERISEGSVIWKLR